MSMRKILSLNAVTMFCLEGYTRALRRAFHNDAYEKKGCLYSKFCYLTVA